ncbi:MAG: Crp/Fnr family transcriptional regulator [Hydrotalea sp.]|nr:Crp/Fnr family transcriptional regulator [Hydrotalea sp.]
MEVALLKAYLLQLAPLSDDVVNDFCKHWQPYSCKRKQLLTATGDTERYLYFVIDGIQRAYFIGENQQEATIVFTYPPSFSGVADSFLTQTPSLYNLETLTSSKFLRISYDSLQTCLQEHPVLQHTFFTATAFALKGALERQVELQCYTNEEKFKTLLHRSPHLLQIIPHKYLASYMGMNATNFSKLLAQVRL